MSKHNYEQRNASKNYPSCGDIECHLRVTAAELEKIPDNKPADKEEKHTTECLANLVRIRLTARSSKYDLRFIPKIPVLKCKEVRVHKGRLFLLVKADHFY